MEDAPRIDAMHELEAVDEVTGGRVLFFDLNEEYRVLVVAEIPKMLRAYVRAHLDEIEAESAAAVKASSA